VKRRPTLVITQIDLAARYQEQLRRGRKPSTGGEVEKPWAVWWLEARAR